MVEFIGNLGQNATKGERKFQSQVSSCFEDNNHIFCYIEPPLGDYRPDFLLISPKLGAIIVEIKDYSPIRLKFVGATGNWVKFNGREDIPISNPYDQIYQYWRSVKNKINHSRSLEKLNVQVSQLVIFSQIDENSKMGNEIKNCKPEKVNICFNDTLKSQNKIRAFFQDLIPINFQMNPKDFDLLRSNLIPSCRLPELQQKSLMVWLEHSDQVKLLDLDQEKMAHELGEGHRIFYGVAGSGKTVLLVARARFLGRKYPKWRILVLCYNKILGVALRQMINPQDYPADIEVDNFHAWARKYIKNSGSIYSRIYDEGWTKAKKSSKVDDFYQTFVPELVLEVNKEFGFKYDAILIDEGQDFESIWYTAVMDCLNEDTSSLLITLDGLQGIYSTKKMKWINVGIEARGRVKKFHKSYRNPKEVGLAASKILPENLVELIKTDDEFLKTEEFLGTHGSVELIIAKNRIHEYQIITQKIKNYVKQDSKILVLLRKNYEKKNWDHPFFKMLDEAGINWTKISNWGTQGSTLLIGTLHATKGLEAEVVIIPELDNFRSNDDRQLLYVGMTRTLHKLILTSIKETFLVNELSSVVPNKVVY